MPPPARADPAFAPIPGGNANVFTRALGLPADPIDATGRILESLRACEDRRVGLGCASTQEADPDAPTRDRYFTFNAGMGLDAEVVRVIEGLRARGRAVSPGLYNCGARCAVLRGHRPPSPRAHPAPGGHVPDSAAVPGDHLQHLAVDLPGPAAGQSEPRCRVRHRAGHLRAPANADDRPH